MRRVRSRLCGHVWCVCVGEVGRGGRGREEGRATDSIEPQNSDQQSLLSGLVRHFHRIRKSFEMLLLVETPNQF